MSIRYTEEHEWARQQDDLIVVGITDYAQQQLGEVVYVQLPDTGHELEVGDEAAVVESVKAAGEVKAPLAGNVVEINNTLIDNPELVNEDATGQGWFYKIRPTTPDEFDNLMDQQAYDTLLAALN